MSAATKAEVEARVTDVLEEAERRERRDSWRNTGGSKRRPLKSFMTKGEKRAARDQHAERIRLAVEELAEPAGFEAWLEALDLNPHLSAMNAALVALQTPGEVVATSAGWRRQGAQVRKGERAAGRITAPGFWPLAYFTAEQAGCLDLLDFEPPAPPLEVVAALREDLAERLRDEKQRPALDAVAKRYREGVWRP